MTLLHSFVFILLASCSTTKNDIKTTEKIESTKVEKLNADLPIKAEVITAPIIQKTFHNKKGEPTDIQEYYIQRSVKDYFIKFCHSKITKKDLEEAMSKIDSPVKSLTLKVTILEGEWDRCDSQQVQSRIGEYMIIHEIIE